MNQAETFEWLRERSNRLDEVEAELAQVRAENTRLLLEKAQLTVKPIVDREKQGEQIGDLMNMRLHDPLLQQPPAASERCPVTCAEFPLHDCKESHQCVREKGHPFDPMHEGEIHHFEGHMMPVEPTSASGLSERCGECGHSEVGPDGLCHHVLAVRPSPNASWRETHCGHCCDFPATGATTEAKTDRDNQLRFMEHFWMKVEPHYVKKHGHPPPEQSALWELLQFVVNTLESRAHILRDAGAILCVNDPDAGARVEIRFSELKDAQQLHKALTAMRTTAPAATAEGKAQLCNGPEDYVLCPGCSEATGAGKDVYHCPPVCAPTVETRSCGFCGKTEYEVSALIQAPLGFICNECVKICADIVNRNEPSITTSDAAMERDNRSG